MQTVFHHIAAIMDVTTIVSIIIQFPHILPYQETQVLEDQMVIQVTVESQAPQVLLDPEDIMVTLEDLVRKVKQERLDPRDQQDLQEVQLEVLE